MKVLREGVVVVNHGDLVLWDLQELFEDSKGFFAKGFQGERFDYILESHEIKLLDKFFTKSKDKNITTYKNRNLI